MSSSYPGSLDNFATDKGNATLAENDHPGHHNNLADAVNKIEAELGVNPAGSFDTVAERFDAVGDWVELTLLNSWVAFGGSYFNPAYRIVDFGSDKLVYFRGLAKDGSITNGTVVATLPEGARPAAAFTASPARTNNANSSILIATDGDIEIYGMTADDELRFDNINPMWVV